MDHRTTAYRGVGASVYLPLFTHSLFVGKNKSNFSAEEKTISFSLQQLLYRVKNFQRAVFLKDSKSDLKNIEHHQGARKHITIHLVFLKNTGLKENAAAADKLTKTGIELQQTAASVLVHFAGKKTVPKKNCLMSPANGEQSSHNKHG